MKSKVFAAASAAMLLAVSASAASAGTVTVNSNAVGYYQNNAFNSGTNGGNLIEDGTRNNFFAFDLSGISGQVTAATLTISGDNGYFIFNSATPGTVTYSVYDVTTDVNALKNFTANRIDTFNDLSSGKLYGSTSIDNTSTFGTMPALVIALTEAGFLNDITAALGGLFALGGTSNLGYDQGFLWSSSSGTPTAAQLTLEVAQTPLPGALWLFGSALAGFFGLRWRKLAAA